jgi:hypothetical protein
MQFDCFRNHMTNKNAYLFHYKCHNIKKSQKYYEQKQHDREVDASRKKASKLGFTLAIPETMQPAP